MHVKGLQVEWAWPREETGSRPRFPLWSGTRKGRDVDRPAKWRVFSLSPKVAPLCSQFCFRLLSLHRFYDLISLWNRLRSQGLSPEMRGLWNETGRMIGWSFFWEETGRKSMQERVWSRDLERANSSLLCCFSLITKLHSAWWMFSVWNLAEGGRRFLFEDGRRSHVEERCASGRSCRSNGGSVECSALQCLHRLAFFFVFLCCSSDLLFLLVPADGNPAAGKLI
jgi:hypothetical protein